MEWRLREKNIANTVEAIERFGVSIMKKIEYIIIENTEI
jgi:hypothetical protein